MKRLLAGVGVCATGWAVLAAPAVTGFGPTSGGPGVQVTITGAGFSTATKVQFDTTAADFTATADNRIVAVVPADATTGKIRVTNPTGTGTSAGVFSVAPRITSFAPPRSATNTAVTINGFNFSGTTAGTVTDVLFNGVSAAFTVTAPTQIRATVPFGATNGPIILISPAGVGVAPLDFQVTGPGPIIDSFSQPVGAPGANILIYGANFIGTPTVRFNGVAATSVFAPAQTQLNVQVPATATTGKVIVTTTSGSATSLVNFVVSQAPYITNFTPTFGKAGVTSVTIQGYNFTNVTGVGFNGKSVAGLDTSVAGQVTVTVPNTATTGPITVTNSFGAGTSSRSFTVTSAPIIDSLDTSIGPVGTLVILRGWNFTGTKSVYFNGTAAQSFFAAADTQLNATVPTGATTGPIAVTNTVGGTISSDIFYVTTTQPFITRIDPISGPRGTPVNVYGLSFGNTDTDPPVVRFNGVTDPTAALGGQTGNETIINATVPAAATTGPITVTTSGGTSTNNPRFYIPPRITSFSPTNGIVGATVALAGTNFTDASNVLLGGAETGFTVTASNRITFPVPADAVTGPITVITPGGTIISTNLFGVLPHIDSFAPTLGAPGTVVTILGSSFQNASAVSFNTAAAAFTNVSSTQLRATVPATATTGPIRVTTPGGTAVSSNSFLVTGASDLALSLTPSVTQALPGASITYALVVANQGVSVLSGVVVTNRLPVGAIFDSATASRGSCVQTSGVVTCTIGVLTNSTQVTIDIAAHLPAEGIYTNVATAVANEPDSSPGNNTASAVTVVVRDVSRELNITPIAAGDQVILSWPTSAVTFSLQSSTNLTRTNGWGLVPGKPAVKGGQNLVTNRTAQAAEFYRLSTP